MSKRSRETERAALREAPTFCPTDAEFSNPLRYILSIREEAEKFGICAIKPPSSWKPPFMLDLNKLKFPTRVQKINELMVRKVQRMKFMKELIEFSDASGSPLSKIPAVGGKELDLHSLYTHVTRRGGFDAASANRQWTAIANAMNLHNMKSDRLAPMLKKYYLSLLLPFERFRLGLDPPPAALATRVDDGSSGEGGDAGLSALASSSGGSLMSRRSIEVVSLQPSGAERSNADACDEVIAYVPPRPGEELCELCGSGDDNESILLCDKCNCGFHMRCLQPPLSSVPAGDWFCSLCLKEKFGFSTTRVYKYHQYERQANSFKHAFFESLFETATTKLTKRKKEGAAHYAYEAEARAVGRARLPDLDVPPDEVEWQFWNIVQTPDQPLEVLYGSDLDTLQFGSGFPLPSSASSMESDVAKDKKEISLVKRYATAGWNLNNLCRLDKCVLAHCSEEVSGMVVPWMYFGMLFSSFCWHVEDHYAHSINYMHWGAPKTWYGVPGAEADAFEKVMQDAMPELTGDDQFARSLSVEAESGLLYKMTTMLPPATFTEGGVSVCHLLQQPGTFVITWPRAYHAGFSHGLNCAESSNFATPDWLPWGRQSVMAYRTTPGSRRPCFTHEMLLCKLACKTVLLSPHIAIWVRDELEAMVEEEERNLISVQSAGCAVEICFALQPSAEAMMRALGTQSQKSENQEIIVQKSATDETAPHDESRKDQHQIHFENAPSSSTPLDGDGPASELPDVGPMTECPSCAVCNYECYLSAVECTLPDGSISYLCLLHGVSSEHQGAALPTEKKKLLVFRHVDWLRSLLRHVAASADAANAWVLRARAILYRDGGDRAYTLAEGQAVVDAGIKIGMDDEHMLLLARLCREASSLSSRVASLVGAGTRGRRISLAQCDEALHEVNACSLEINGADLLRSLSARGRAFENRAAELLREAMPSADDLDRLLSEGAQLGITLPSRDLIHSALATARWESDRAKLYDDGASPPGLSQVRSLVASGRRLGGSPPQSIATSLHNLEVLVSTANAWLERHAALMKSATLVELEALEDEALHSILHNGIELPQRVLLKQRLTAARAWLARYSNIGCQTDPALVETAVQEARPLAKVEEVAQAVAPLRASLAWRDGWVDRATRAFVKPGSKRSLLAILRDDDSDTHWPPGDEENLHCCAYCSPDDDKMPEDITWVGCDICDGWFHACCLFVPDQLVEKLDEFICPRCCGRRGQRFSFHHPRSILGAETPPPQAKRTRRPDLAEVRSLMDEAMSHNELALPEAQTVSALQQQAEAWCVHANHILAPAKCFNAEPATHFSLGTVSSNSELTALLIEADALEVVPDEVREFKSLLTRYNLNPRIAS